MYTVPKEHYFRIHHVRPRFKNDVERVLLFVSTSLSELEPQKKDEFVEKLNNALYLFPGNQTKALKTINNWRTEISSLFSLISCDTQDRFFASYIAKRLADRQDLVEFFKTFLYTFQYPGGHIKPKEIVEQIQKGVKFKPAQYVLRLLALAESKNNSIGISKAEFTHLAFNDLRVTRDNRDPAEVLEVLLNNRRRGVSYDQSGDVIRYAGDILDYLVYADLLKKYGSSYYLNKVQMPIISKFCESADFFKDYVMLHSSDANTESVSNLQDSWVNWVNTIASSVDFSTDIVEYLGDENLIKFTQIAPSSLPTDIALAKIDEKDITTKDIGDKGESICHGHECMRLKIGNRLDLIQKVVSIPNKFAIGYDIRSFELTGENRLIEVKSTISNSEINFNQFHMSENEWNHAQDFKEKYFVYRLSITRAGIKLFIIRNPLEQYRLGHMDIKLAKGADIKFKKEAGIYERLLVWQS